MAAPLIGAEVWVPSTGPQPFVRATVADSPSNGAIVLTTPAGRMLLVDRKDVFPAAPLDSDGARAPRRAAPRAAIARTTPSPCRL